MKSSANERNRCERVQITEDADLVDDDYVSLVGARRAQPRMGEAGAPGPLLHPLKMWWRRLVRCGDESHVRQLTAQTGPRLEEDTFIGRPCASGDQRRP